MGILDVKIDIERVARKGRSQRIESLRTRSIAYSEESRDRSLSLDHNSSALNIQESRQPSSVVEDHRTDECIMDLDLHWAATKNDVDGFIDVLERVLTEKGLPLGAIWKSVTPLGNTLLHVAASFGNEETVRLIASHSPSLLTKKNLKGDTALHVAAKNGEASIIRTLTRLGNDFTPSLSSPKDGVTEREVALVELMLSTQNDEGNTALHEALINGHRWVVPYLVSADMDVLYYLNNEEKSVLYLAAEAGHVCCVGIILEPCGNENLYERLKGKSPVHAAIMGRNLDVLGALLEAEPRFIHLTDEEGRSPLHCAASTGYLEGVRYLLGKYKPGVIERDKNGLFPIHMASIKGHVDIIQELLQNCPDPRELIDCNDQNILHAAAERGRLNVVCYILKTPKLGNLINKRDRDGNTPLHLATMHWHPKIVSALTWDDRVDLKLTNNEGLTALDAAEYYMERIPSFRQPLTWVALKAAGAPRAPSGEVLDTSRQYSMQFELPSMNNYKDRVNTLLLVSTLVATVTFAAGFTMPGGYNNNDPDQGMATLLRNTKFHVFVFCDTIAMYSSMLVAVTLTWAQLGDLNLVLTALRLALPLLGIALTMMSLAFMAGVYLVVGALNWLATAVLVMGLVFLVALSALSFPLCFPISSNRHIVRYISYYPFCLLIWVTGSCTDHNSEE